MRRIEVNQLWFHDKVAEGMMLTFIKDLDFLSPGFALIHVAKTTGSSRSNQILVGDPFMLPHKVIHWAVRAGKVHFNYVVGIVGRQGHA